MLVHVAFRISETIAPPFPNKTPTWLDGTTSCAVTDDSLFDRQSSTFSIQHSIDLQKTSTTASCAGETLDSGFCQKKEATSKKKINKHT